MQTDGYVTAAKLKDAYLGKMCIRDSGYTGREAIARENEPESGRSRGYLDSYDYPGSSFPDNFFYHR